MQALGYLEGPYGEGLAFSTVGSGKIFAGLAFFFSNYPVLQIGICPLRTKLYIE